MLELFISSTRHWVTKWQFFTHDESFKRKALTFIKNVVSCVMQPWRNQRRKRDKNSLYGMNTYVLTVK